MNKITRQQVHSVLRNNMGWGDAKRKLCELLGVKYHWDFPLPQYVKNYIIRYYHPVRRRAFK